MEMNAVTVPGYLAERDISAWLYWIKRDPMDFKRLNFDVSVKYNGYLNSDYMYLNTMVGLNLNDKMIYLSIAFGSPCT